MHELQALLHRRVFVPENMGEKMAVGFRAHNVPVRQKGERSRAAGGFALLQTI